MAGSASSTGQCEVVTKWQLDEVEFQIIPASYGYPKSGDLEQNATYLNETGFVKPVVAVSHNDASCVGLVRQGNFTMLLPGDIQKSGEDRLLSKSFPPIDVLIAPHHGGLSSSSPPFLNHLSPGSVIISAGHLNRFGHPHRRVLARYHNRGMTVLNTASSAAVTLSVDKTGRYVIEQARKNGRRFWYD